MQQREAFVEDSNRLLVQGNVPALRSAVMDIVASCFVYGQKEEVVWKVLRSHAKVGTTRTVLAKNMQKSADVRELSNIFMLFSKTNCNETSGESA